MGSENSSRGKPWEQNRNALLTLHHAFTIRTSSIQLASTVWATDSGGNFTFSLLGVVSGSSTALKALEPSFHQDLNGDGTVGIPASIASS